VLAFGVLEAEIVGGPLYPMRFDAAGSVPIAGLELLMALKTGLAVSFSNGFHAAETEGPELGLFFEGFIGSGSSWPRGALVMPLGGAMHQATSLWRWARTRQSAR